MKSPTRLLFLTFPISPDQELISLISFRTGVIIQDISNVFNGAITRGGIGTSMLEIVDMSIPSGIDSFTITAQLDDLSDGIYMNQARLSGLPISLGMTRVSDDPETIEPKDSTALEIFSFTDDPVFFDAAICGIQPATIDASTLGGSILWSDGSTEIRRQFSEPGRYTAELFTPCDSVTLIYDIAQSTLQVVSPQTMFSIIGGDSVQLSAQIVDGPGEIYWIDSTMLSCANCLDPTVRPLTDQEYTIFAIDSFGCVDSLIYTIQIDPFLDIYIPNAFTPNGDQLNDSFYAYGSDYTTVKDFRIFDRWGNMVMHRSDGRLNDESFGWDGTISGQEANPATFVYLLSVEYFNGQTRELTGEFYLIR